jgi:hypothetical protein
MNDTEPQTIQYDITPLYENDYNGINGGARKKARNKNPEGKFCPTFPKVGGDAIASGGYGCVFKPALQCKGQEGRPQGKISKLMLKRYAEREYEESQRFLKVLSTIPNYTHYFLLNDFTLCEPAPLTQQDLANFQKCRALPKDGINQTNINQSLSKLLSLSMPYGGIDVEDYFEKTMKYSKIIQLNNHLIQLLNHGIVPMNRRHIYHNDIKDSNVLVQETPSTNLIYTRLIDWGISVQYKPGDKFPSLWENRPFQFNTPFSIILFTDLFVEKYAAFYRKEKEQLAHATNNKDLVGAFVLDYISGWLIKRGPGHYKTINNMFYILFSEDLKSIEHSQKDKEQLIETHYTLVYIKNYLVEIIYHFSKNLQDGFYLGEYLNKVFIKIVDVWGFISIYFPLLEELFEFKDSLTPNEKELFESLKRIILTYLYNPRVTPISIKDLNKDLRYLNQLFDREIKRNKGTTTFLTLKSKFSKKSTFSKKKRFQSLLMVTSKKTKKNITALRRVR